ncbi:zinc finger protein 1 [Aphis craccivora]|uniref:Zinc finger protein 1 n=1 Tax=Aphis craccivora TaxID=307492 RepID=A0A6G0ZNU3_APHCR|nr:zinc finger protein 1 [Aphis craccivora]
MSHHSIKNENGIYLDFPPLSSVKEEVHQCLDNGDVINLFLLINSERSNECIDFTMLCFKFLRNLSKTRKFANRIIDCAIKTHLEDFWKKKNIPE